MADAIWYVGQGGQQKGPFSEEDVQAMLGRGELGRGDVVWKEGMAEWKPFADVPEFAEAAKSLPPGPPPAAPAAPAGPSPAAEFFTGLLGDTMAIVRDPDAGSAAVADKKCPVFAAVWVGLKVLFAGLLALQVHASMSRASSLEGAFEALGRAMAGGGGGYGESSVATFFKTMLMDAIAVGILFGALLLVMAAILRVPEALPKALAVLAISYIPIVAASAVAFVFGWLHLWFQGLVAAAMPASILLFYHVFQHTTQTPRRQAIVYVAVMLFGVTLIAARIARF